MVRLNGMTLKVDKAGRVILPKPVRDRLGLHAGSDLDLQDTPEGILLKPASPARSSLARSNKGLWVYTGRVARGFDPVRAIEEDREERIRRTWHP